MKESKAKKSNRTKVLFITQAAMIAAIYVVLVEAFAPISFSGIQCRIAEALTILPYFTAAAIPGVTVGCLLANIIAGGALIDIVFGTIATLLGAIGSYAVRKYKWAVPLPPIIANTIIVPWVLRLAYADKAPIYFLMATVGIGEVVACGIFGMILLFALQRYRQYIFHNEAA